ncbi:uncharacterized protein LJ206_000011 isoform 1-T1 [Theristicus caerulescens]
MEKGFVLPSKRTNSITAVGRLYCGASSGAEPESEPELEQEPELEPISGPRPAGGDLRPSQRLSRAPLAIREDLKAGSTTTSEHLPQRGLPVWTAAEARAKLPPAAASTNLRSGAQPCSCKS